MKSSIFLLRCFILTALVYICHSLESARIGRFFKTEIQKVQDFNGFWSTGQNVSFNFTTRDGYPELPPWLHLEQRTTADPAFLYGTPRLRDKNVTLEVIGWNKDNYLAPRKTVEIEVTSNEDDYPWYQAEFLITNVNLDQFLAGGHEEAILKIVKDNYWNVADLSITWVESALSRGGRIPLPNSNKHEGVYVRVGSHLKQSSAVEKILQTGKKPDVDYFKMQYEINWSKFRWMDLRTFPDPDAQRQALLPKDKIITSVAYGPPQFDDSARNFDGDFILAVVIPILVALIVVLFLSLIMCFGREGREKRDNETPNLQLTHHHNIQRSTMRLRELSKPTDQSQTSPQTSPSQEPSRPRHGHGEYERIPEELEDYGTDGRNAPPPYRMPPAGGGSGQQV